MHDILNDELVKRFDTAVVMMNTGTADAPNEEAIRTYLKEFLADRHVVDISPIIWKPVLNYCILPHRPKKTLWRYEKIWTDEGSKFMLISRGQRRKLAAELDARGVEADLYMCMRYGNPGVERLLSYLKEAGYKRLIILSMFPQYARCTAASVFDRVREVLGKLKWNPEVIEIREHCYEEAYLDALARTVRETLAEHPLGENGRVLFSYHSTLVADIKNGDPYVDQATHTSKEVAKRLSLSDDQWEISWQCRFDSRKWLEPSPEKVLTRWVEEGVRNVIVTCPVFSADCAETLIDCEIEQRELFENLCEEKDGAKTGSYTYSPAVNDNDDYIAALANAVEKVVC